MSTKPTPNKVFGPVISRLADVMIHVPEYSVRSAPRLATDAGVDRSTVTRLMRSSLNPSFALVCSLTEALEKKLGKRIDPRDIFAVNGSFLTPHVCDLIPTCNGCWPPSARDEFGAAHPDFVGIPSGGWVTSKYPRGYLPPKGSL